MGAHNEKRKLLVELPFENIPQLPGEHLAVAWSRLAEGLPSRFYPNVLFTSPRAYGFAVHSRVYAACTHGPAKRRVQALMWMKKAILLSVHLRLTGVVCD